MRSRAVQTSSQAMDVKDMFTALVRNKVWPTFSHFQIKDLQSL